MKFKTFKMVIDALDLEEARNLLETLLGFEDEQAYNFMELCYTLAKIVADPGGCLMDRWLLFYVLECMDRQRWKLWNQQVVF